MNKKERKALLMEALKESTITLIKRTGIGAVVGAATRVVVADDTEETFTDRAVSGAIGGAIFGAVATVTEGFVDLTISVAKAVKNKLTTKDSQEENKEKTVEDEKDKTEKDKPAAEETEGENK